MCSLSSTKNFVIGDSFNEISPEERATRFKQKKLFLVDVSFDSVISVEGLFFNVG
jgi:hypothetical protein